MAYSLFENFKAFIALARKTCRRVLSKIIGLITAPRTFQALGSVLYFISGQSRKRVDLDFSRVAKVCIIRLDEIGDVTLTTPLIRELRRNLPNAYISIIVKPALLNLLETCPYVDQVLTFDWMIQGRLANLKLCWRALKFAKRHFWTKRYDLVILPRWGPDTYFGSFLAYLGGARHRVGYSQENNSRSKIPTRGYDRFLSLAFLKSGEEHEVIRNLQLLEYLGGQVEEDKLELWLPKRDKESAETTLRENSILPDVHQIVAFCPGAGQAKQRWPVANFLELGRNLKQFPNIRILLIGGPDEDHLGRWLVDNLGDKTVNLIGKLTLRQTAAVLSMSTLYVGNDTGPMHLAAAMNTPIVEISQHPQNGAPLHPNSPKRFGPWGVPSVVLQPRCATHPCTDSCTALKAHCIRSVRTSQVKETIIKLLGLTK